MTRYYIRSSNMNAMSTIYFNFQKCSPPIRIRVCTHLKIETKVWNAANKSVNSWTRFSKSPEGKTLVEKLDLMQQAVQNLYNQGKLQGENGKELMKEALEVIACAEAIEVQKQEDDNRLALEAKEKQGILRFFEYFVEGIRKGTIRYGYNRTYSWRSLQNWDSFKKHLYEYCSPTTTFDDVNKEFADGFCAFLESKHLLPTTCNKKVICFRKLCNAALEYGVSHNTTSMKVWKERVVYEEEKKAEIYLTVDELEAYYNYPLTGIEEHARDLFMLGYLSCQRYSDYGSFSKENFGKTFFGTPIIKVRQAKNGNYVEVPIVDKRVMEICDKYEYNFPRISARKFNDILLEVSKKVAEICPSLMEKYVTALTFQERRREKRFVELQQCIRDQTKISYEDKRAMWAMEDYAKSHNGQPLYERNEKGQIVKYKYELVTSHTARRSGVTNLYKTGLLDTREMMAISGHKTEAIFENYIKVSKSEQADRIAAKLRQQFATKMTVHLSDKRKAL